MELAKMRTIDEAYTYIVGLDEGTGITRYFIRELCKQQKVHCIKTGKKYLVNIEDLCNKIQTNINI
ncbi:MAG: hypothetical protein RR348_01285 [Clostridia bacterium]